MAVRAVVNQKGENVNNSQFLLVPVGNSIKIADKLLNTHSITYINYVQPFITLTSGFLPAKTLNMSNRRFRDS